MLALSVIYLVFSADFSAVEKEILVFNYSVSQENVNVLYRIPLKTGVPVFFNVVWFFVLFLFFFLFQEKKIFIGEEPKVKNSNYKVWTSHSLRVKKIMVVSTTGLIISGYIVLFLILSFFTKRIQDVGPLTILFNGSILFLVIQPTLNFFLSFMGSVFFSEEKNIYFLRNLYRDGFVLNFFSIIAVSMAMMISSLFKLFFYHCCFDGNNDFISLHSYKSNRSNEDKSVN